MKKKKILIYILVAACAFAGGWYLRPFQDKTTTIVYQDVDEQTLGSYSHPIEPTDKPDTPQYTFYGGATIENKIFQDLKIFGPAKIIHSMVKKNASVFGPLHTVDTKYRSLSINGALNAETCEIDYALINGAVRFSNVRSSEILSINGALTVEFSKLNNVEISSVAVEINESTIKNIFIHADKNQKHKTQRLILSGHSHIDTITFEGGNGVVVLEGDEAHVKTVQGAKIERTTNGTQKNN